MISLVRSCVIFFSFGPEIFAGELRGPGLPVPSPPGCALTPLASTFCPGPLRLPVPVLCWGQGGCGRCFAVLWGGTAAHGGAFGFRAVNAGPAGGCCWFSLIFPVNFAISPAPFLRLSGRMGWCRRPNPGALFVELLPVPDEPSASTRPEAGIFPSWRPRPGPPYPCVRVGLNPALPRTLVVSGTGRMGCAGAVFRCSATELLPPER